VTDWLVTTTCVAVVWQLRRHASGKPKPRWYLCYMGAFVAEGISCFGGGFMWCWGLNKLYYPSTLNGPKDIAALVTMTSGMAAEGLLLILTHLALRADVSEASFGRWVKVIGLSILGCCGFPFIVIYMDWPYNIALQAIHFLPIGVVAITSSSTAYMYSCGGSPFQGPWRLLCLGSFILLTGAAIFGIPDNDCTGRSCITEYLPWESSPCRWYTADPKGSSCPLPEWFNHSAVMHCFAIASCIITTLGVQGLLDSGWEPGCQKPNID